MTEYAVIYDLPQMLRYAVPLQLIREHKWDDMVTQGGDWRTFVDADFTPTALKSWLINQIDTAVYDQWVLDGEIKQLGVGATTTLADAIEVETVPLDQVPNP